MLGDKRRDLRLSDDAVVESHDFRVGVGDGGGDAVEGAIFDELHLVSAHEISHGHLLVCARLKNECNSEEEGEDNR